MAKTCGLCGYAANDQVAFDEHMRSQHQWDTVSRARSRPLNPGIAAQVVLLGGLWLFFGIAILLPIVLARRDGGLDLRKPDHAIAVLIVVPVVFLLQWVVWPRGPLVLPSVGPRDVVGVYRLLEYWVLEAVLVAMVGLARFGRGGASIP
jgi:hypothetical protein